jgi:hypothetical protein
MGHFHKWGWDEVSMVMLLESSGFTDVRRMRLHQSAIADVTAVETREDLTVEGVKRSGTAGSEHRVQSFQAEFGLAGVRVRHSLKA